MTIKKEIKKLLLINPPSTIARQYTKEIQPPLGLAYIASCLENIYEVKILDAACEGWHEEKKEPLGLMTYGLSYEDIKQRISDFKPDIVGVSCLFSMQYKNAHRVCAIVKEIDKSILTIMGGAHPTALPDETLKDLNVDFVVLGEGEYSTKVLLEAIRSGASLSGIDGIAFRDSQGIIVNPKTRFIENLDEIPFPARHLLSMEKYFNINMPHGSYSRATPNTNIITSRGCPAKCTFCSIHGVWGFKFRARSVGNIIEELKLLKRNYGIREIQFEDDNLTFDKVRASLLFDKMIQENLNLSWNTPNGIAVWSLDKDLLVKMKESGCYWLVLAIESGDQKMLYEIIKKPLDLKKAKEIARWARELGFQSGAFFIVGYPEESMKEINNTFRFAYELDVDTVDFHIATPYPGTELLKTCQEKGYLVKDFSLEKLGVKRSNICNKYISEKKLRLLIIWHTFRKRLSLLWRNPRLFSIKIVHRLSKIAARKK